MTEGVFSRFIKTARAIPLYKTGEKEFFFTNIDQYQFGHFSLKYLKKVCTITSPILWINII